MMMLSIFPILPVFPGIPGRMEPLEKKWVSNEEAQAYLGVSKGFMQNLREKGKIRFIEKAIGKTFVQGVMPTGTQICEKQLYKVIDDLERIEVNEEQIEKFLPEIFRRLDWMDKNDIIKRIVTREFGRFVRYYQDAPELEEVTRNDVEGEKRKKKDRHRAQKGYTRFFINIGKKDHVQPVHIIEMLNRNVAGRVDVGRIDLMQNFSFFECPEEFTEEIVIGMDGINYKGRQVHVEVAETRSENGEVADVAPARERKSRREEKPSRERKPKKEEKPRREDKPRKEEKPRREEKPLREEKPRREEKTSRTPKRAPTVQIAQDDDFWNNFENEDWHQFFRSEGAGKSKKKSSARKEKPARKEKVNGRKAARTKPSKKSRR